MKKLIILIAVTLTLTAARAHSQNSPLQVNSSPSSNFMSRFAVEGGVNIAYPIQNLADYNSFRTFNFTASIYTKIINRFSLYFNYSYMGLYPEYQHGGQGESLPAYYIPTGNIKSYNIGGNFTFEYKKHIPFIEGGIGLYTLNVQQPHVVNLYVSENSIRCKPRSRLQIPI